MHGNTRRFRLADVREAVRVYPPEHQEKLLTIYGYWMQRLHGDKAEVQHLLQTDWTTWGRILRGVYRKDEGHNIDHWIETKAERALQAIRADSAGTFVHTVTTRRIHSFLDYARETAGMALIIGDSGTGKTEAVREWARQNNHGASIYLDCPTSSGLRALLEELALVCGLSTYATCAQLCRAVESTLDTRNILIVDEAQRLLPATPSRRSTSALDFLRRLHDTRGVTVIFVSTAVFDQTRQPAAIRAYMAQLYRRVDLPLALPAKTPRSEVYQIVEAFRDDPPTDLLKTAREVADQHGRIGLLFTLLNQARKLADHEKRPLCETDLNAALALRRNRRRWPKLCPECKWSGMVNDGAACPDCGGKLLD